MLDACEGMQGHGVARVSARLKGRWREVAALCERLVVWAPRCADVRAVILVGSYARGRPRMGSDVDVMVLVEDLARYAGTSGWASEVVPRARWVRRGQWGPVVEHRWRLASGLHVEFGLAAPSWAQTPLDPGSATVLQGGARVLYDPEALAADAVQAARTLEGARAVER